MSDPADEREQSRQIIAQQTDDFLRRYGEPRTELIEAGRVRDFLLAMDEPVADLDTVPVPALFLLTLGRTRRPQPARGSAVNAGDEFEFLAPVHVGDRITLTRHLDGIEEKQGKQGQMFLTRSHTRFTNQHDQLVAISRGAVLRWGLSS